MPGGLEKLVRRTKAKDEVTNVQTASASSGTPLQSTLPSVPEERYGLFELSNPEGKKTVDVVAVHGLQGDAFKTWEHDNGSIWIRDFLPNDIPFARIMTFGYESTVAFSKSVATLEDKALDLLNRVATKRSAIINEDPRPIVFVCHSFGGIVVKKALIMAHDRSADPDFKDVLDNTKAIAFLGVPRKY